MNREPLSGGGVTGAEPPSSKKNEASAEVERLLRGAVEVLHLELRNVDTRETARVDRDGRPVRPLPARKRLHPANLAEQMTDMLAIEL
jgi:hypothetical protein